jgi:hypothetical protein
VPLKDNLLKYGVLSCRDLVELYYGARMVVSITENAFSIPDDGSVIPLLLQDPRRIRYEINWQNQNAIDVVFSYGSPAAMDLGTNEALVLAPGTGGTFERNWITDQEGVCLALSASGFAGAFGVSTRETFLTPAPVDEVPLG